MSKKATEEKPAEKPAEAKADDKPKMSMVSLSARMDAKEKSDREEMDAMRDALRDFQTAVDGFSSTLKGLEARFGKLEVSAPPALRALEMSAVAGAIKADPYAEFEVLSTWKHLNSYLPSGRVIRADHYPMLIDYVRAGLKIGVPQDQAATVAAYKAKADDDAARAKAEVQARADKAAAEAKAAADKLRGE